MTDEQTLIRLARAGDGPAFEALVTAYETRLYQLAFRYLGHREDALDAVQETFLRVYRFLGGFQEQSSFSTWIYHRHQCLPGSFPAAEPPGGAAAGAGGGRRALSGGDPAGSALCAGDPAGAAGAAPGDPAGAARFAPGSEGDPAAAGGAGPEL